MEKSKLEGISDAPLTDTGKTQAQTLGAILSKKYIPSLYVLLGRQRNRCYHQPKTRR